MSRHLRRGCQHAVCLSVVIDIKIYFHLYYSISRCSHHPLLDVFSYIIQDTVMHDAGPWRAFSCQPNSDVASSIVKRQTVRRRCSLWHVSDNVMPTGTVVCRLRSVRSRLSQGQAHVKSLTEIYRIHGAVVIRRSGFAAIAAAAHLLLLPWIFCVRWSYVRTCVAQRLNRRKQCHVGGTWSISNLFGGSRAAARDVSVMA